MTSIRKVGNAMIAAVVAMDSIGDGRIRKGWCLAPVSGAQGLGEAPVESMKLQVGALNGAGHPAVVSRNFLSCRESMDFRLVRLWIGSQSEKILIG